MGPQPSVTDTITEAWARCTTPGRTLRGKDSERCASLKTQPNPTLAAAQASCYIGSNEFRSSAVE